MAKVKTLADRVAFVRGLSGLSRRALSDRAGLDPSHVRLLEDGDRKTPRGDTIVKIARALGVSTDWLLTGEGITPTRELVRAAVEPQAAKAG